MSSLIIAASFGIFGALMRVAVDYIKCFVFKQKMKVRGVLFYGVSAIIIGAFLGIVLDFGWAIGFLSGYAGLDILDGLYKVARKIKITAK